MVDAIRIRIRWGNVQNISHKVSTQLGELFGMAAVAIDIHYFHKNEGIWWYLVFAGPICACIRLAVYPVSLNFYRFLLKVNPGSIFDYISQFSSSETDAIKWWAKIGFWQQRALAVAGVVLLVWIYSKIA